ncbi:hypothetical protein EVAR_61653_1 [Eumeta japonica]|uniref:Uncharacterized protein n=1 Tax=Eumeta variegata TaxID=151549 RepID=A0A4C1Z547_EUMVA|nr:hypothetical protein EVAR_61653_1 [Eumeta japonica]
MQRRTKIDIVTDTANERSTGIPVLPDGSTGIRHRDRDCVRRIRIGNDIGRYITQRNPLFSACERNFRHIQGIHNAQRSGRVTAVLRTRVTNITPIHLSMIEITITRRIARRHNDLKRQTSRVKTMGRWYHEFDYMVMFFTIMTFLKNAYDIQTNGRTDITKLFRVPFLPLRFGTLKTIETMAVGGGRRARRFLPPRSMLILKENCHAVSDLEFDIHAQARTHTHTHTRVRACTHNCSPDVSGLLLAQNLDTSAFITSPNERNRYCSIALLPGAEEFRPRVLHAASSAGRGLLAAVVTSVVTASDPVT